jgi:hypothetical protein
LGFIPAATFVNYARYTDYTKIWAKYTNHPNFYTCGPLPAHSKVGGLLPKSLVTPVFFKFMGPYALNQSFLVFLSKKSIDLVP